MKKKISEINPESNKPLKTMKVSCDKFTTKVILYNAMACNLLRDDNDTSLTESKDNLIALKAEGGIQEMLVAQMTSIHLLQQTTITLANRSNLMENKQYYINATVKLANCFTQQATLLAKLQDTCGQKVIVEHVEVHNGGQAVVGNINGGSAVA